MPGRPQPLAIAAFAAAVLAVPLGVIGSGTLIATPSVADSDAAPDSADDPLVGLWSDPAPGGRDDGVRFYYFHGNGQGLYRYGRVGFTNTNSFDYTIEGDVLTLVFRKTGERHQIHFSILDDANTTRLVMDRDPKNHTSAVYVRRRSEPVAPHAACDAPLPAGRLWFDRVGFATGGYGFTLYQLRCAGIDGRGTGWFHRGDFDDWTTEALVYRITDDRLEMELATTAGRETTHFSIGGAPRTMQLTHDPRDFWHSHEYADAGPSFGAAELTALDASPLFWAPPQ